MEKITDGQKIKFELWAPMMYWEDMEKAFKVKGLKKLPKLQQHIVDWMRTENGRGTIFDLKGTTFQQGEEYYVIQPDPHSIQLQFPKRYFEIERDEP